MDAAPPGSFAALLEACLARFEEPLAARRVRIVRHLEGEAPPLPAGDARALADLVTTLIAEAAAGTIDGGRVRVSLRASRAAVMLAFKDQGDGFAPGAFEARVADTDRPPAPGAPLTLSAGAALARDLGGNLFANATPGKGATYYLTLPPPRL